MPDNIILLLFLYGSITETEKAYIAGIIDGEGSIMLTKFHSNQYHSPSISVASTDIELLDWIKDVTKMGKIMMSQERKKNNSTKIS